MTWTEIITIEPELEQLRLQALKEKSKRWTNWEIYKHRISSLAGWNAANKELIPEYDTVYQIIRTNFERNHVKTTAR